MILKSKADGRMIQAAVETEAADSHRTRLNASDPRHQRTRQRIVTHFL
jgi:hypothetical protein